MEEQLRKIPPIGNELYSFICTACGVRFREPHGWFVRVRGEDILGKYYHTSQPKERWWFRGMLLCDECQAKLDAVLGEFRQYGIEGEEANHGND